MSRMVVYGLDNSATGAIPEIAVPRGWAINAAAETKISLDENYLLPELLFGRMVTVEHPRLPPWAGMIDPPWRALLPVSMTVYDAAYLLNRRSPDQARKIRGTTGSIALKLLELANEQEPLGIIPGDVRADDAEREESFDQRNFWDQMLDLVKKAGYEMRLRPVRDGQNRLQILLDIVPRLGVDTGYLLHDGEGGNLEITDAEVIGPIWTRVYASGDQATRGSRLAGDGETDDEASRLHRLRSTFQQFSGVQERSVLQERARTYLLEHNRPVLVIKGNVLENDMHPDTFKYMDLGNTLEVHSTRIRLPGGIEGWRGRTRLEIMALDDIKKRVGITIMGAL